MENIIIFCQQNKGGNIWDALLPIIFFAVIIFLRLLGEMMKGKQPDVKARVAEPDAAEETDDELIMQIIKESRKKAQQGEKKRKRRPQRTTTDSYESVHEESRPTRTVLARELGQQGAGSRFEAQPGTLGISEIAVASIEPTVKPTLDSLTGIYDEQQASETTASQAAFSGLYAMLAQPEGIRNAVVLSEIFSGGKWQEERNKPV